MSFKYAQNKNQSENCSNEQKKTVIKEYIIILSSLHKVN